MAWLARPVAAYLRAFHNRTGCTMVPTREIAEDLAGQRFERLRVVGRGVDPAVFSPARRSPALRASWGADDNTLVALCVSRFAHEKNFALVIEAYEAMRAHPRGCEAGAGRRWADGQRCLEAKNVGTSSPAAW